MHSFFGESFVESLLALSVKGLKPLLFKIATKVVIKTRMRPRSKNFLINQPRTQAHMNVIKKTVN